MSETYMTHVHKNIKIALLLGVLIAAVYLPAFMHSRSLAVLQESRGESTTVPVYGSDSGGFVSLAENLLANANFGHSAREVETFRTPGYPLLLAAWKKVFGSYTFFPLAQIALVYLSALLLYCLGVKLYSRTAGIAVAFLFVLDPNILFHSLVILSELPHVFFLVFATWLLFASPRHLPLPAEFLSGVTFGLAVLVKPVSLYLPVFFALYLFVRRDEKGKRSTMRPALLSVLVFALAYSAVLTPWLVRNHQASGVWGISSVSSFNLFHYTVPEFLSYREGITPDQARVRLRSEISVPPQLFSDLKYAPTLTRVALRHIAKDPLQFAKFYAVKTIPFFFSSSLDNLFVVYNDVRREHVFNPSTANLTNFLLKGDVRSVFTELVAHPVAFVEQLLLGLLVLFALLAVFAVKKSRAELVVCALSIVYFAAVTGPVAYARFRIPASPFLFTLAVIGFLAIPPLLSHFLKRNRKRW